MIRPALLLVSACLLLLLAPRAAEAQYRTYGAGWTAGASYVTDLTADGVDARDLTPGAGIVAGVHFDRWYGEEHRVGLRLQGSYQQPHLDWSDDERSIDTASGDLSLLYRLTDPEEPSLTPFLAGGLGGIWYDLGRGSPIEDPSADALHDGRSKILLTGVLGAGVDIPVNWDWHRLPVQLRVELADHVAFRSPLLRIEDGSHHGMVHHLRFTIGAHSTFRRR